MQKVLNEVLVLLLLCVQCDEQRGQMACVVDKIGEAGSTFGNT